MDPTSLTRLEKALYSDAFSLGVETGRGGINFETLTKATSSLYRLIDDINESLLDFAHRQSVAAACLKGCSFCCHQPVFASTHEIFYLKRFISQTFTDKDKVRIQEGALAKNNFLNKLSGRVLLNSKYPCPLLNEGACQVYVARPVSCRIYFSFTVSSCKAFYDDPAGQDSIPGLLEFPLRMGRRLNEGFIAGLKVYGFISREFRIEEGLLEEHLLNL